MRRSTRPSRQVDLEQGGQNSIVAVATVAGTIAAILGVVIAWKQYRPSNRRLQGGHVLVTSRNELWRDHAVIRVQPWARAESLDFLRQSVPPAGKGHPAPGDVGLVALLGLLGGALSAAVAVRKLSGTSTPYAVPITLSVLKLPFGALTAVAGLLLLHGQFVPGLSELDSQGQILAYAVVLGVAQQVATQFVDRRAHEVLSMQPTPQGHGEQPPSPESSINRHHAYDHGAASPDGEDRP